MSPNNYCITCHIPLDGLKQIKCDVCLKKINMPIQPTIESVIEKEKCSHNVVGKYCFNCKFKDWKGLKIEMFNSHHYVRLKDVQKLVEEVVAEERNRCVEIVEKEHEKQVLMHDTSCDSWEQGFVAACITLRQKLTEAINTNNK